jgi:hypothetical protein
VVDIKSIQQNLENAKPVLNQILSRILFKRIGKPIWDYKTDLEIMYGACDLLWGKFDLSVSAESHPDGNLVISRYCEAHGDRMDALQHF